MNNTDFFQLGDVARILRCQPHRIVYLLTTRQVPEPLRIGNKRVFTTSDIQRIAEKLQVQRAQDLATRERGNRRQVGSNPQGRSSEEASHVMDKFLDRITPGDC